MHILELYILSFQTKEAVHKEVLNSLKFIDLAEKWLERNSKGI